MPMPTEKIENKALVWLHYPWIRATGFEESLPGPKFKIRKKRLRKHKTDSIDAYNNILFYVQ